MGSRKGRGWEGKIERERKRREKGAAKGKKGDWRGESQTAIRGRNERLLQMGVWDRGREI